MRFTIRPGLEAYGLPDYQIDAQGRLSPDGRINSLALRRFDRYRSDRGLDKQARIGVVKGGAVYGENARPARR